MHTENTVLLKDVYSFTCFKRCYLFEGQYCAESRDSGRENKRQIFHLLSYSQNDCNIQGCARLKPGVSCFFLSPLSGQQGLKHLYHSLHWRPRCSSRELDLKWDTPDVNCCPYGMLSAGST